MISARPCFMFAGEMGDGGSKACEAEEGKRPTFLGEYFKQRTEKNLEEIISLSNKAGDCLSQAWLTKIVTGGHYETLLLPPTSKLAPQSPGRQGVGMAVPGGALSAEADKQRGYSQRCCTC